MAPRWRSHAARAALAGAAALALAAELLPACSTTNTGCEPACTSGEVCDRATGTCRPSTRRAVATCPGGCPEDRPLCDQEQGECVVCTSVAGCGVARPYCDTSVPAGRCVECKTSSACPTGSSCDVDAGDCVAPGGEDAGIGCVPSPDVACTDTCASGYTCIAGRCVLNGADGALQVSVRWDQPVDLDLHLSEPTPDGPCDIFYGSAVAYPDCHPVGKLDLDSNPDCKIDGRNLENIVYPDSLPAPSGSYSVGLTYYSRCERLTPVNYQVDVRIGGAVQTYCGTFPPTEVGGPWHITSFVIQ